MKTQMKGPSYKNAGEETLAKLESDLAAFTAELAAEEAEAHERLALRESVSGEDLL